jgi:signal transduction histidine kinase
METKAYAALIAVSVATGYLYFVVAVLSLRFAGKQLQHKLISAVAVLLCAHSFVSFLFGMHKLVEDIEIPEYLNGLQIASEVLLTPAVSAGFSLALLWASVPRIGVIAGGWAVLVVLFVATLFGQVDSALIGVGCLSVLLTGYSAVKSRDRVDSRYKALLASALLLYVVVAARFPDGALEKFARVLPVLCTFVYVVRHSIFGLLISKRFLLFNVLAGVSAFYLLLISAIGNHGEDQWDWFGRVFEMVMVSVAAIFWIPLYNLVFRSVTARTERFSALNQRLIQEAVRILELDDRGQFLVDRIAAQYKLTRAMLCSLSDSRRWASGAEPTCPVASDALPLVVASLQAEKPAPLHVMRTPDPTIRSVLERTGYTYVFPLWYDEQHLTGLLLADLSPRKYLDDDLEAALGNLAAQVAHSLESCKLVEQKIVLEKTLVRQEHLATLGKVAATIAHEVKNPLSSIKTLAQLMREDEGVNQQYEQDLRFIIGETDRLNSCVQQLLTFSRPVPDGGLEISLNDLLGDIGKAIGRDYEKQQIRLELQLEPELRLVGADMQSIQQVIMNLTLNAMQASSPGTVVRLEAHRVEGKVQIVVTDQGCGIPSELREKIFEPFFTTKQKGTGLGLAIVRKNVRHMDGDLQVLSPVENGRGTRITVTLPLQASSR